MKFFALLSALVVAPAAAKQLARKVDEPPSSALTSDMSPVRKVVTLIQEMKDVVDKEAGEDMAAHEKFMCWCTTNEKAKTAAIADAQTRIEELSTFIEEATAKIGALEADIAQLSQDIKDDQEALATAEATHDKDFAAFQAEEVDMKETRGLLDEAVAVLAKVQLLQKSGRAPAAEQSRARAALLQVQEKVKSLPHSRYASVMQRDLFDMLGSLSEAAPGLRGTSFEQAALPQGEKSEEQIGMESKPNGETGAAAGAKSYNSKSGGILGLISEMKDQFTADLAAAQKQDFESEVSFQHLKAAKLGEIAAAEEQKTRKEAELADTTLAKAKAEEDREATQKAMEADQEFLANLQKDCKEQDEQYKARLATRSDEQVALAETLKILTEDDARDLYEKTGTFLQLSAEHRALLEDRAAKTAMLRLVAVAKQHKNWALAALAVRVRLDAFGEVKEAMDKMLAELGRQQKEDIEKKEFCDKEIDRLEDETKVGMNTKEDLDEKHQQIVNTIESAARDIEALKAEEEEMKVSLKQAGENRKAENHLFQTSVADQRATISILSKALTRLQQFYTPKAAGFLQQDPENKPGQAIAPRPDTPKAYSKSGGAGGVLQLLQKVITDAETEEKELEMDEQHAQENYAEFVQVTTNTIEADRAAIEEKSAHLAEAEGAKAETEEAKLSNDGNLANLDRLLKAQHLDCDWLLKYFQVRQEARQQEMDAIGDAKAVLSGANFGK